ncbi:hypothetical protein DIPPA_10340 [Diplonema papillatum]|nr:hypothetical protein DIPPA_05063 [Diplonema papillatum]KAJ9448935.1 hypothetical protein DIPPA_10340 [Diplonema papillatum]
MCQEASSATEQQQQHLEKQYDVARRTICEIARQLHLPFLETKLYLKFFVDMRDECHLPATLTILNALLNYKRLTVVVLSRIREREDVLAEMKNLAYNYTTKTVGTMEAQSKALALLYGLQQYTAKVLDAIAEWRALLTRPFPFVWNGVNYIMKVVGDCRFIDSSELKRVLPVQLAAHPLCSTLTSLATLVGTGTLSYPMKKRYTTSSEQTRLHRMEAGVYEELGQQKALHKELAGLAADDWFLPCLSLPSLIPNCATGIKVTNAGWAERYRDSIRKSETLLDNTGPLLPPSSASAGADQSPPDTDGSQSSRRQSAASSSGNSA